MPPKSPRAKQGRTKKQAKRPKKANVYDEAVIMIDMNPRDSWTYPASLFAAGWVWDGGATALFGAKRPRYTRTEWFYGPFKSDELMKERIEQFFERLKLAGKVTSFRVRLKKA